MPNPNLTATEAIKAVDEARALARRHPAIHYVTFGQVHTHRIADITFDCDSVAYYMALDADQGRAIAFELFDRKFCFEYHGADFNVESLKYFPRGLIAVPQAYVEQLEAFNRPRD